MALTGLIIILFFVVLAVLAPVLTNENPIYSTSLASPYSVPQWAVAFPQYSGLPLDTQYFQPGGDFKTPSSVNLWTFSPQNGSSTSGTTMSYLWNGVVGPSNAAGDQYDLKNTGQGSLEVVTSTNSSFSNPTFTMSRGFDYQYKPAQRFRIGFYASTNSSAPINLVVGITVSSPSANYTILQNSFFTVTRGNWTQVVVDSQSATVELLVSPNNLLANVGKIVLSTQGRYTVNVNVEIQNAPKGTTHLYLSDTMFYVFGSAYGVLGTDSQGRSIFSQFVYGAQVSLEVGLFAAAIVILLASVVGVVSGYYGGWVEEVLMRLNDLLLSIPILPLLLVLILVIDVSGLKIDTEELVILLIGFLGWEVYARAIRSQVLSVKEKTFVNAARTLGVKPRSIVRRHIIPNVAGLIYALLSQAVPVAILLEAALSFLGFYDPRVMSWGRMLGAAQSVATVPTYGFVWWWFLPPGVAIALISVSFIFIGNALDEMFNPKILK